MDSLKEEEQLNKDSLDTNEQPTGKQEEVFFELDDGTKITKEEAKQGYLRQSDYTKKTTALAEEKKNINPELEETMKILKEAGVVTKEDIAGLTKFKEDTLNNQKITQEETVFNDFVGQYTNLSDTHKTILKDLKKVHTDKSYDDILKLTGFVDQALIEKSKTDVIPKGDSLGIPKEVEELSVDKKVSQKYGLKPISEINKIKSQFNL